MNLNQLVAGVFVGYLFHQVTNQKGIGYVYPKNKNLPPVIQGFKESDLKFIDLNDNLFGRRIDVRMGGRQLWTKEYIVKQAKDTVPALRKIYKNSINVQEKFVALFLNQQNQIIGYYEHSLGSVNE